MNHLFRSMWWPHGQTQLEMWAEPNVLYGFERFNPANSLCPLLCPEHWKEFNFCHCNVSRWSEMSRTVKLNWKILRGSCRDILCSYLFSHAAVLRSENTWFGLKSRHSCAFVVCRCYKVKISWNGKMWASIVHFSAGVGSLSLALSLMKT